MAMKMALMMERDWVELTEMDLEQPKEFQMETNLACLLAESMEIQMGLMTDVGSEKPTETLWAQPMELN